MHPSLVAALKIIVGIAIPIASLATGLRSACADPRWLGRHLALLARALLTILVIVPVGAVVFLQTIAAPPLVRAGITMAVVAIGIGPPAAFGKSRKREKQGASPARNDAISFEIGLNVLLLVLAIVYIPAFVAIHGAVFHHSLRIAPAAVAKVVLSRALLPLAVGILVGRLTPRVVAPLARVLGIFVQLVLLLVIVVALLATWRSLVGLGGRTWLTCAAIALGEILLGYATGGPELETRRVLASFSAMRFPALALLLVQLVPGGRELIPVILAYVITTMLLVGVHGAVTSRRGHAGPAAKPRGRAAPSIRLPGMPGRSGAS